MSEVLVTGIGMITCIGNNTQENYHSLINKKCGISKIKHLNTVLKDELPAGEINLSNVELGDLLGIDKHKTYSRTTLLALIALKEAIADAAITTFNPRIGLISSSTVGGIDISEKHFSKYIKNKNTFHPNQFIHHDGGDHTRELAKYFGITGFTTTISTACSSAANAIILGASLIKNNTLDKVIVGGTDALTRFTLNGFHALLILDNDLCKPFDEERKGLNLGEGAAYLVLESQKSAGQKKVYGKVKGYANANDAFHQTASSPEGTGALLAMTNALKSANLQQHQINYINVHGTGTPNNDSTEGLALEKIFNGSIPPFSSTKTYTGHTLAACGAIEAIFSLFAINHNTLFPNLRFKTKTKEVSTIPILEVSKNIEINHVLSNSFGFGGNNTTLIFSKN